MPLKGSKYMTDRDLAEIAAREDSDDDDYDDREQRSRPKARARSHRGGSALPRKKQKRGGYKGSDISDDENVTSEEEVWTNEDENEEVEINEATGRPRRGAAKKTATYKESDEEESSASEAPRTPRRKAKVEPRRKVVTLKVRTPIMAEKGQRVLRERKPSITQSHPSGTTRRTRRMSEEEPDDLVELSTSGRHVVVARAASHDSDLPPWRATRHTSGIKYPSKSTIDEATEPEDSVTRLTEEVMGESARTATTVTIPSSQMTEERRTDAERSQEAIRLQLEAAAEAEDMDVPRLESDVAIHLDVPVESQPRPEIEPLSDDAEAVPGDDDDEGPVPSRSRTTRSSQKRKADSPPPDEPAPARRRLRPRGETSRPTSRRRGVDETSDFAPEGEADEAEDMSESGESDESPRKRTRQQAESDEQSHGGRRSTRLRKKGISARASGSEGEADLDSDELIEELADLKKSDSRRRSRVPREELVFETRGRRTAARKDYNLLRALPQLDEDDEPVAASPSQRTRRTGGGWQHRSLHDAHGPFGGAGGRSLFGGPGRPLDADTDSSDEEVMKKPKPVNALSAMTPMAANNPFNPFAMNVTNNDPAQQGLAGTPANLGKVKDKQALADADPLGVDQNVDFDSVGGLQGHIDQLKEMVALPLLYPEIFMRFKITPPRGVLFHGPPGTGKTLLARALATSVSSQGRKVTFYMRKGADALSKWVGEAERQLRLLFEEARKNQPSIIFFDEIDGLAPVRSSKQEQIHASIVSTLLALMDGMDGRGQVIVIGATNRPDSIDPALRRPGRFDREFYFPLPDTEARRSIINIHTRGWEPPLNESVKDELAKLTKGYGGADLRALCTEAALNAVQRRYPQIYGSKEKLIIDPKTITVTPKDFMISIKKIVPSSERAASSAAAPLPHMVEPLLRDQVDRIISQVDELLPRKKKVTALEEAMFEDVADGNDFGRERMQQTFETARIFRPRFLVYGRPGMGQQYVVSALLNHLQGVHVQSFDLAILLGDTTSSPEATVIRLFAEVKTHKPSVIYIPDVREWFETMSATVLTTFFGLLKSLKSADPVLVLAHMEGDINDLADEARRELFGYAPNNLFRLRVPSKEERTTFFTPLREYIGTHPNDFPDPAQRKKRKLEILPVAPPDKAKEATPPSKEELKAQKKKDRVTLNVLKQRLQPIMDQIRTKYKKFRTGVIEDGLIRYLYEEADPGTVTSDLVNDPERAQQAGLRPYKISKDAHGAPGLEHESGKFFYNIETVTIEKRLSNGYYKRPKDFLADIKRLAKDAKAIEDEDRMLKANELLSNVEVDIVNIEMLEPGLVAECEKVYQRELDREKEAERKALDANAMPPPVNTAVQISTTTEGTGPIQLGVNFDNPKDMLAKAAPETPHRSSPHDSVMTNGWHDSNDTERINGSSHEADDEADTHMQDSNHTSTSKPADEAETPDSFGRTSSAQPKGFADYTAPSQALRKQYGMVDRPSQSQNLTPVHGASQAAEYSNKASTTQTSSDRKPIEQEHNTSQDSVGPNLFLWSERRSQVGSDIPETQGMLTRSRTDPLSLREWTQALALTHTRTASQRRSRLRDNAPQKPSKLTYTDPESHANSQNSPNGQVRSQPMHTSPPPLALLAQPSVAVHSDTIHAPSATAGPSSRSAPPNAPPVPRAMIDLLNPPFPPPTSQLEPRNEPDPNVIMADSMLVNTFMDDIITRSSRMTVEQLEQVNGALMNKLWKTRGVFDRRQVLEDIANEWNEVTNGMKAVGQHLEESNFRIDTSQYTPPGTQASAYGGATAVGTTAGEVRDARAA